MLVGEEVSLLVGEGVSLLVGEEVSLLVGEEVSLGGVEYDFVAAGIEFIEFGEADVGSSCWFVGIVCRRCNLGSGGGVLIGLERSVAVGGGVERLRST